MAETPDALKQEIKLFYCYSHEDEDLRNELEVHISSLKRHYNLTHWHDRKILPGIDWRRAIDQHLATSNLVLLLISPYFMASDYCYGEEMQRALELHRAGIVHVIPIILRPTHWENTPFSALQMLPTDAKPVTSWPNYDMAFHDIVQGINNLLMLYKIEDAWSEGNKLPKDVKAQNEEILESLTYPTPRYPTPDTSLLDDGTLLDLLTSAKSIDIMSVTARYFIFQYGSIFKAIDQNSCRARLLLASLDAKIWTDQVFNSDVNISREIKATERYLRQLLKSAAQMKYSSSPQRGIVEIRELQINPSTNIILIDHSYARVSLYHPSHTPSYPPQLELRGGKLFKIYSDLFNQIWSESTFPS